jgi:tryptophan synthase alpha chain
MGRIEDTFKALKQAGRKGLVGYLTAGDPDAATSEARIREAIRGGLDVLELGVPFSDPTADGPVIQEASQRALAGGMSLGGVLAMVRSIRRDFPGLPIVLFGYANPFFRHGYEALCREAAEAGADGLLVVDLPFEEWGELQPFADRNGLRMIALVAPTTPGDRAKALLERAGGFVYYIMVRGVTGARDQVATDVGEHVRMLRAATRLPIAGGFGVSRPEQARAVAADVDAVVVGSALVRAAQENRAGSFVAGLRAALDEVRG